VIDEPEPNVKSCAVAFLIAASSPAIACPGLEPGSKPYLGELNFKSYTGLSNVSLSTRAGGNFNLRDCGLPGLEEFKGDGLVRVRPMLLLHWEGNAPQIVVSAKFVEKILRLVHEPDGKWILDDGLLDDPLLTIEYPAEGDYAIYLGTHGTEEFTRPGTLIVSEVRP
jgi:hypothetical protein